MTIRTKAELKAEVAAMVTGERTERAAEFFRAGASGIRDVAEHIAGHLDTLAGFPAQFRAAATDDERLEVVTAWGMELIKAGADIEGFIEGLRELNEGIAPGARVREVTEAVRGNPFALPDMNTKPPTGGLLN